MHADFSHCSRHYTDTGLGYGCRICNHHSGLHRPSLYLFIAIPGKLVLGHIYDRYGVKAGILFWKYHVFLSVICLIFIKHQPFLYLMAILFGFGTCIGTVSARLSPAASSAPKHYAEIYGFLSLFPSVGYALGGPLIASAYDLTGSYNIAWIIVAALSIVMTAFLLYSYRVSRVVHKGAGKNC